jgi:Tol biopolymer transport system component
VYPDGKSLLVGAVQPGAGNFFRLLRLDLSTAKTEDLGRIEEVFGEMNWLEPGKSLIFGRRLNGLTNLWKYNLADGTVAQATSGTGPDFDPMPDPSGQGVYYVNGKRSGTLIRYDVKTGSTSEVSSEFSTQPIVSPDGKRVLYVRLIDPGKSEELWVADIDGRNSLKLASASAVGTGFWSPDSARVAFFATEKEGENNRAFVIGVDGRNLFPIEVTGESISNVSWSADAKSLYVTTQTRNVEGTIWKTNVDGTNPEKLLEGCYAMDATPDGKYLLGVILAGKNTGIYQISLAERKHIPLLPGVETFMVRMAQDKKSFLYSVAGRGEILFYRQKWNEGKLIGEPELALKLPFAFPLAYFGNAYDFSSDLSTIVYAKPGGQADLYYLSLQ